MTCRELIDRCQMRRGLVRCSERHGASREFDRGAEERRA